MSDTSPQPMQAKNTTVCIEHEKLKLHFAYLVIILVFAMILLATGQFTPKEKFTEYLSNAATLVSVVLGLVAIFYSFISNDSLSKSLGSISNVSEQIAKTREQISIYVDRTAETGQIAESGAKLLNSATVEMKHSLSTLTEAMEAIRTQTGEFSSIVGEIPVKLEKLETTFLDAAKSFGEKPKVKTNLAPNVILSDPVVEKFLATSSLSSNLITIACVLAAKANQDLELDKICEKINMPISDLMTGYVAAMNAVGLISAKYISGTRSFKITEVNKRLTENAESYYEKYIYETFKDDTEKLEIWRKRLDAIKELFPALLTK